LANPLSKDCLDLEELAQTEDTLFTPIPRLLVAAEWGTPVKTLSIDVAHFRTNATRDTPCAFNIL
jgi:hypothetical protein